MVGNPLLAVVVLLAATSDRDGDNADDLNHHRNCNQRRVANFTPAMTSAAAIGDAAVKGVPDRPQGTSKNLNGMGGWGKGHDQL